MSHRFRWEQKRVPFGNDNQGADCWKRDGVDLLSKKE